MFTKKVTFTSSYIASIRNAIQMSRNTFLQNYNARRLTGKDWSSRHLHFNLCNMDTVEYTLVFLHILKSEYRRSESYFYKNLEMIIFCCINV